MMKLNNLYTFIIACIAFMTLYSCQSPGVNQTGSEYMGDMAHSVAYEANTYGYFKWNRWGSKEDLHAMSQPRGPIDGTIARGYAGDVAKGRGISYKANGSVPYYYGDTEEERARATAEIIKNPYPITKAGLDQGKELYNINCGICHGEKGDGAGYLVRDDGGKYPVQPANFMLDDLINSSNGRYYHSIMYGKNLMGGYSDKLSYQERWNVIHYIRSLQASSKKLEYSEKANTFTKVEIPGASIVKTVESVATNTIDTIVVATDMKQVSGKNAEKH